MAPDPISWHAVCQVFPRPELPEPPAELRRMLVESSALASVRHGCRIAIAVGSRGIPGIASLVAEVVAALSARGAEVFVVPAMGSHGGATASEQECVLASLGIHHEAIGAPVVSRPEVKQLGATSSGVAVWVDAAAWEADLLVPINRVKPHTAFRARVESGPSKLLAVGLGKAASAKALHRAGLERAVTEVAGFLMSSGKIPFGLALVENAYGGVARLAVLKPQTWFATEAALLEFAWELYPRLPWQEIDLLVVERMGKDISGTGMDLNIVGLERRFPGCGASPRVRTIAALALTEDTRGNANGVGYADVVTRALAEAVDWQSTYANARATGFLQAARLPYVAEDEADALRVALSSLGLADDKVRAVRIQDTAHLVRLGVSTALLAGLPDGLHKICG